MALLTPGEGSIEVPDFVVTAVIRNAEFQAELTVAFLDATELACKPRDGQPRPCGLPADTLLELGAVLQLKYWELHGFRPCLPEELPTFREAAIALAKRATERANDGKRPPSEELSQQVCSVWLRHFAWDGRESLQADMVLDDVDEDKLVDAMADFLWSHRHDVQRNPMD
jgi:hypothetical protein